MGKGILIIIISFVLVLSLTSCRDAYEEMIITDIEEYDDIWKLSERRVDETSLLFPKCINEGQYIAFICKHTTYQLIGTGWQVLLEIRYDDSMFFSEVDRLNNLCIDSLVCGYSKYFDNLAYAAVWNWNSCFEYALIDEKEKSICYIYLQLIEKDDLIIDKRYVPKEYEMQLNNSKDYSVYTE